MYLFSVFIYWQKILKNNLCAVSVGYPCSLMAFWQISIWVYLSLYEFSHCLRSEVKRNSTFWVSNVKYPAFPDKSMAHSICWRWICSVPGRMWRGWDWGRLSLNIFTSDIKINSSSACFGLFVCVWLNVCVSVWLCGQVTGHRFNKSLFLPPGATEKNPNNCTCSHISTMPCSELLFKRYSCLPV